MSHSFQQEMLRRYTQPDKKEHFKRQLNNDTENVSYIPDSNIRIWYNTESESYSTHHHDALEVILCIENGYIVRAHNQTYKLYAGDFLILPPNQLHELVAPDSGSRFIFLYNIKFLSQFHDYKILEPIFMNPYFCTATSHPQIYPIIHSILMRSINTYFANGILWETTVFSDLLQIFSIIAKDFYETHAITASQAVEEPVSAKPQEHFDKIAYSINYIDANFAQEISLETIANLVGFSKFHFSRLFKQYTGQTFYEYLCRKRIQEAQQALLTNLSITEIALQTGFNSPTAFCRCFKKITGCSPTEYRKQTKKGNDNM